MTASLPQRRTSAIVAVLAGLLVGAFVAVSTLLSVLPAFRLSSQFPALLPFFVWAGATGVGHLANLGRSLLGPWRSFGGIPSVVPYLVVMLIAAAAPHLDLPWWLAPVVAACSMAPFMLLAVRSTRPVAFDPAHTSDERSMRGTFLIGVSLMLLAYAVAGSAISGAVIAVLLAVALAVASMMTDGLARASQTWRLRHWMTLTWGSLIVWASVLVAGLTDVFSSPWWVLVAVLAAGSPLLIVNALQARGARPA